MATTRVTASNALALVRQLATDLRRFMAEAGTLSAAPKLPQQLDDVLATCAPSAPVVIEVWLDDDADLDAAVRWLVGTPQVQRSVNSHGRATITFEVASKPVQMIFASSTSPAMWASGTAAAALTVWFVGAEQNADLGSLDERTVLRVLGATVGPSSAHELPTISRDSPDGVLTRILGSSREFADMLHAAATAKAVDALAAIAGLAIIQEARAIRARRTLAQQRAALQTRTTLPLGDVIGALRTRLQRMFVDFTRGLDDRFVSALTAPSSEFWKELDGTLQGFDHVDQERRVKTVVTRLPAEAESAWLTLVRSSVHRHGLSDLTAMRDMLRAGSQDVEKAVIQAGGPPITVQFQSLTDQRLDRLLEQYVAPHRNYQGELPRPGAFEYFMIARRYQMVAFMFLSAFGLSFVRSYREFMIPLAVLLLLLGALQVTQSVRRERVESVQKELDKIRELLKSESRRMMGEMHRAWIGSLSQHLSDQLPLVLGQVETAVRDHFARVTTEGADERQRLQRQLQAFEVAERKLMAPEKGRETVAHAVANVRGELRQLTVASLRAGLPQGSTGHV